ncbi:MAG TPA: SMC-Scp complex subunit ScpB [Acidimicrobiia bacterium]|nr:SMC-Scp complex subunit ScpB [Acidimicrobiia bacterium]
MSELSRTIEAVLFVCESPISTEELAEITERPLAEVADAIDEVARHWSTDHGIQLHNVAGGWRLATDPELHPYLERYASTDRSRKLSKAAVETLAVVAYRQPVSRGQVTEIRGVDSEHAIRTLERRDLVAEVGRSPGMGQAVLYGTTSLFLEKMGIASLADLPPLADHVPPAQIMETLEIPFRPETSSND